MIRLGLENAKHKHRKIPLTILSGLLLYAFVFQWLTAAMPDHLPSWPEQFAKALMVKNFLFPLFIATIVSRLTETDEHMGRLLGLFSTPAESFYNRFLYALISIAFFPLLSTLLVLFSQTATPIPWLRLVMMWSTDVLTCTMLVSLQLWLALRFANPFISYGSGLLGAFCGFMGMLLPPTVSYFIPWSYFNVFALSAMTYQPEKKMIHWHWLPFNWFGILFAFAFSMLFVMAGRRALEGRWDQ